MGEVEERTAAVIFPCVAGLIGGDFDLLLVADIDVLLERRRGLLFGSSVDGLLERRRGLLLGFSVEGLLERRRVLVFGSDFDSRVLYFLPGEFHP